jgi:hypothetical protein
MYRVALQRRGPLDYLDQEVVAACGLARATNRLTDLAAEQGAGRTDWIAALGSDRSHCPAAARGLERPDRGTRRRVVASGIGEVRPRCAQRQPCCSCKTYVASVFSLASRAGRASASARRSRQRARTRTRAIPRPPKPADAHSADQNPTVQGRKESGRVLTHATS